MAATRETAFGRRPSNVVRIALTGGPAGGKTSLIEQAKKELPHLGYVVLVVNETSTEQRLNGVRESKDISPLQYQRFVTEETIWKEGLYERIAACQSSPTVIISDRGVLDGKAFLGDDEAFEEILSEGGLSTETALAAYDAVLHLVTAADGAYEHYGRNNPMRTEAAEGAIAVDRACGRVWGNHPRRRVVGNDGLDFPRKMWMAMRALIELIHEVGGEEFTSAIS